MKNIVVFVSGNGSNFETIAAACKSGELDAEVKLLVCDKKGAFAIERAKKYGIETLVLTPKDFPSKADYESEILKKLSTTDIDLICLAGYMRIIGDTLLEPYQGKIINTHPALLPSFKGMHAIEQAVEYGVKIYGITIHYVDSSLDGGKIIDQASLYYDGDDIEYLKEELLKIEHALYISVIKKLLSK